MKKAICIMCLLIVTGSGIGSVYAASGKCTVVKVDGTQMVIECEKNTKGFSQGGKIKIKSDNKKAVEGC